jgi:hypothetical protein
MSSTQQLLLGEGAGGSIPVYIEDVFSTYLYTGTGAALTITNNIDLSTKGGLVWVKNRAIAENHHLVDTVRGGNKAVFSNSTTTESTSANFITAFNTTGFTLGSSGGMNDNGTAICSWTFREQPKFFDVVTYSGNSTAGRQISHNLGSVPGSIFIKPLTIGYEWNVWHRSLTAGYTLNLNARFGESGPFPNLFGNGTSYVAPTSTNFTLGSDSEVNGSGETYIAYIFAHNAGGFGLAGTDNVITCGSYVGDGTTRLIDIGYEPQWVLIKNASNGSDPQGDWRLVDNMRGFGSQPSANSAVLKPNLSNGDQNDNPITIASQGFNTNNMRTTSETYIYIAIRRGPMKVPTSGTSVFAPFSNTTASPRTLTTNFVSDLAIQGYVNTTAFDGNISSRLQNANYMRTTSTTDEYTGYQFFNWASNTALISNDGNATKKAIYAFSRAPSYLDVVCYTGTGANRTISHNLAAVPELMIVKQRGGVSGWLVYAAGMGNTKAMRLNSTQAEEVGSDFWNNTTPTSTVFSLGNNGDVNQNTGTYINYLFATCAGVSKVGSYTGNGSTQTINCGFTSGARFVLIKRTDSTGDWYTYDTARGMTVLTDPYLRLNSTAAEVATLGSVTTVSTGFALDATILAAINTNAASYIFLAIA